MIQLKEVKFLCAQPAIPYYAWQVEVMLNNFDKANVNLNNVEVICWKENGVVPEMWSKLASNYAARFFFYDDTRETKEYISSIRPNIIKQHFQKYPELENETILYHDCDIVFTKQIGDIFTDEMICDDNWYGSDTRWYIGHDYIASKGEMIINTMCNIVGIDREVVRENELNAIGAQYLMKGVNYEFWDKVERDCEKLFKDITILSNQIKETDPKYHEVQIWCADMWAVLWNAWLMGKKTICEDRLQFAWATSPKEDWSRFNIFHNAGVTGPNLGFFYKAEYMNSLPYNVAPEPNKDTASWFYWNEIQETTQQTCLL